MVSISVRQSIRWPPAPASEPTSTVVLTSPGRWFVDVRALLPLADSGSNGKDSAGLDWAFAGTSSSTPADAATGARAHSVWRHWVDSRTAAAETVADEGDCEEEADGTTRETGRMVNPATGQMAAYEEIWADVAPRPTATAGAKDKARCVVLQLHDEAAASSSSSSSSSSSRGVVVRLGQFCQGLARTAENGVVVERWQWTADAGWQLVFRTGQGTLPCQQLLEEEGRLPQVGAVIQNGNHSWTVIEAADVQP